MNIFLKTLYAASCVVSVIFAATTVAQAQYVPFPSGLFLNKNGVEANYQMNFLAVAPSEYRVGGKLDNVTFGLKYLAYTAIQPGSGFGVDVGYDWRFAKHFGLNSSLIGDWYNYNSNNTSTFTKTSINSYQVGTNFYAYFEDKKKIFFLKPFLHFNLIFDTYNYTRYPQTPTNSYLNQTTQRRYSILNLGLGFGIPNKNFVFGLMPVYSFGFGFTNVSATLGYNFSTEQSC